MREIINSDILLWAAVSTSHIWNQQFSPIWTGQLCVVWEHHIYCEIMHIMQALQDEQAWGKHIHNKWCRVCSSACTCSRNCHASLTFSCTTWGSDACFIFKRISCWCNIVAGIEETDLSPDSCFEYLPIHLAHALYLPPFLWGPRLPHTCCMFYI